MELHRAEEIQSLVDTARAEIKEAPNSGVARELARELRTEVLLKTASLTAGVFNYIEENPTTTTDELWDYVESTGQLAFPEAAEVMGKLITGTTRQVEYFMTKLEQEGENAEKVLFRGLQNRYASKKPQDPADNIRVEQHPLAVAIYLTPRDFDLVDPRQNIGGFYSSKPYLYIDVKYPFF